MNALQHAARALALIPGAARAAVLMRHAERGGFAKGHHGNDIPLTIRGEKDAAAMGALLRERNIALFHSPVIRCRQTAAGIGGANPARPPPKEWPGLRCDAYVEDFEAARPTLLRLVSEDGFYDRFVKRLSQAAHRPPYPHFRPPFPATAELLAGLLPRAAGEAGIGVTHDWLVNVAASHATGRMVARERYADFLDALFVWEDAGSIAYYHKGETGKCPDDFQEIFIRAVENQSGSCNRQ